MKYRAVIFDLDGVICETDRYHYQAWKELADKLGVYFDENINEGLRGVSRLDSLNIILKNCKKEISEEEKVLLAEEKNAIYKKLLLNLTCKDLNKEVKETLEALKRAQLKLAIGSSSKNARLILRQIGLDDFFDAVSDGSNISRSKPDPEVFIAAANMIKIAPDKCIVVEDAKAGIEAAASGGMDCAAIGSAAALAQATYNISRFSELLDIIL